MALQEYFNTGDNAAVTMANSTRWTSTGFLAGSSYTITSVKLKLYVSGTPGTVTVSIRAATSVYVPTGSDLTPGVTNGNTLTTDTGGEWREIDLTPYAIVSGTKYAIVVRASAGILGWRGDSIDNYTNGNNYFSFNSGSSWSGNTAVEDHMFEVYGYTDTSIDLSGTITGTSSLTGTLESDVETRLYPPVPTYWYDSGGGAGYYYQLLVQSSGSFGNPPPTGVENTDYVIVTYLPNFIRTNRRLIAAAKNSLYYEDI